MNDAIRAPRDVDVVTFFVRPENHLDDDAFTHLLDQHPDVFDRARTKRDLSCDAYWVDLSVPAPFHHVDQARYWFGLFSHRRVSQQWKGMIQLPLGSFKEDQEAANILRFRDDS